MLFLLNFVQGNRHIRANHPACICLDSKPTATKGVDYFSNRHQAAGFANSSSRPNAEFVNVGFDTILNARIDMDKGMEVLTKYDDNSIP